MASRQFFSTFENKLDSKNRISIPASFRAVIKEIGATKLILRPSRRFPSIEAYPDVFFEEFESKLETREVFSDEHDDMAWDIYSDATEAEPDRDGRIVLTPELIAQAQLSCEVSVIGLGKRFEIWDRTAARSRAADRRTRPPRPQVQVGTA